ncbi:hypothetical protein Tco_0899810 [Tanacetum coccineum]
MRGTRGSASKSTTTKSVGKWKFLTLTKISSATPLGRVIDRSANSKVIRVGVSSGRESLFQIERGITRFMLVLPRSSSRHNNPCPGNYNGKETWPGSPSIPSRSVLRSIADQFSVKRILANSSIFSLFMIKLLNRRTKSWHQTRREDIGIFGAWKLFGISDSGMVLGKVFGTSVR